MNRPPRFLSFAFSLGALLLYRPPLEAQSVATSVAAGVAGLATSGSTNAFKSQYLLGRGFFLEDLSLSARGADGKEKLSVAAWGFGGAEPAEAARLAWTPNDRWKLEVDYDKRWSFFGLEEADLGDRNDLWRVGRWRGALTWDGAGWGRFSLKLRRHDRTGTAHQPGYGLNDLYPLRLEVDESFTEAALLFETTADGPFHLSVEPSWGRFERMNRWSPDGADDDVVSLVGASSTRVDEQKTPGVRASATYRTDGLEALASFLWSGSDLAATGDRSLTWALGGGTVGTVEHVDQTVGSASLDTLSANVRLGVGLGGGFVLRLTGNARDRTTDSALLGQRLLRITNAAGDVFDFPGSVDEAGLFDTRDVSGRAEVALERPRFGVWAGGFLASREVRWKAAETAPLTETTRDTDGLAAGFSVVLPARLRLNVDYERGSFADDVFRTDPETVDRFRGRLRGELGSGFSTALHGRWETAGNPASVSGLDRRNGSGGLTLAWDAPKGSHGLSLDVEAVDLRSETGVALPGPGGVATTGTSIYDLSLLTVTAAGRTGFGRFRLSADATRIEDRGDTWPVEAWSARGRVSVKLPASLEASAFVQYWDYDEGRADGDDYRATRYGLVLRWELSR